MGIKVMQSNNKRKNRIGKNECMKIMKNRRLTEKERLRTKVKEKIYKFEWG